MQAPESLRYKGVVFESAKVQVIFYEGIDKRPFDKGSIEEHSKH